MMSSMPSRRGGSQRLSGVSHGLAGLLLLAGCTSVVSGAGYSKADLPAKRYDLTVFLCATNAPALRCSGGTTPGQTAALRARLLADPATAQVLYLSERDQLRVARYVLPAAQVKVIRVGDLPASFLVSLADPDDARAFQRRYARSLGVDTVTRCEKNRCSVELLRRAGVVH